MDGDIGTPARLRFFGGEGVLAVNGAVFLGFVGDEIVLLRRAEGSDFAVGVTICVLLDVPLLSRCATSASDASESDSSFIDTARCSLAIERLLVDDFELRPYLRYVRLVVGAEDDSRVALRVPYGLSVERG